MQVKLIYEVFWTKKTVYSVFCPRFEAPHLISVWKSNSQDGVSNVVVHSHLSPPPCPLFHNCCHCFQWFDILWVVWAPKKSTLVKVYSIPVTSFVILAPSLSLFHPQAHFLLFIFFFFTFPSVLLSSTSLTPHLSILHRLRWNPVEGCTVSMAVL